MKSALQKKRKYKFKKIIKKEKNFSLPICRDFASKYNNSKYHPNCDLANDCENAESRINEDFGFCSGGSVDKNNKKEVKT